MKSNSHIHLWTILIAAISLSSCGGNDPSDPGNQLTGVLTGSVSVINEYGREITDRGGVVVSMEGTTYSTTTNAEGVWRFDNLPAGTYVVNFAKPGFATLKYFGYQFVGGGIAYLPSGHLPQEQLCISQLPSYTISSIQAKMESDADPSIQPEMPWDTGLHVTGTFSSPTPTDSTRLVVLYIGRDNSVSRDGGAVYDRLFQVRPNEHGLTSSEFSIRLWDSDLRNMGFGKGDRIYVVVYPATSGPTRYYDAEQRKYIDMQTTSNNSGVVDVLWQ